MKKIPLLLAFVAFFNVFTSAQGINFEKFDWNKNLTEASADNKLVYIDFFTTWCGPCTYMANNIFPKEEVGTFYNKNFYCLKIDAEKEGLALAKKYKVSGYPTNLFIDPSNQEIVYKVTGAPMQIEGFIQNGKVALIEHSDPIKLFDYKKMLSEGKKDKEFLVNYLNKLNRVDLPNNEPLDIYSAKYFKKNIDSVEIDFMDQYLKSINNKTFKVFKNNKSAYQAYRKTNTDRRKWDDYLITKLFHTNRIAIAAKDKTLFERCKSTAKELLPPFEEIDHTYYLNWMYYKVHDTVKQQENEYIYAQRLVEIGDDFFKVKDRELLNSALNVLDIQSKTWTGVPQYKIDSLREAKTKDIKVTHRMTMLTSDRLNAQAWNVFETKDSKRYNQALQWANKAYEMAKQIKLSEAPIADTYANMLFVTGNKAKAILIEKEAIQKAKEQKLDASNYEKVLATFME